MNFLQFSDQDVWILMRRLFALITCFDNFYWMLLLHIWWKTKYPCQMEDELKLIHSCKLYQDCLIIRFIFSVDLIKKG